MIKNFLSKQFLRYLVIGFSGTGLDFLLIYVFVEYFHLHYLISALISIALILFLSFSFNKYWTFENQEKKYFNQLLKYILASSVGWGINLIVLTILVEVFGMWYLLAKVFATAVALIWNFLIARNWVFKSKD